ncbi:MAG: hypothetical protein IPL89_10175 [Acidobacteria bacterium]|nr:hypothetical protein [Acidobacteriota bacterium]
MDPLGALEYMNRDWALVAESKERYWRERLARLGPAEALRVAGELRRQARAVRSDWPSAADRADDLAAHVRLAELFRRAGAV